MHLGYNLQNLHENFKTDWKLIQQTKFKTRKIEIF